MRRIEQATGVGRETASACLKSAGVEVHLPGWRHRAPAKPAMQVTPGFFAPFSLKPPVPGTCEAYRGHDEAHAAAISSNRYCVAGVVRARLHAEELDVNGAAESRIEKHVPARMAVVVIDIDAVAIPFPVAAARNVVGRDDPIGIVVQNDMPRARIEAADNNDVTDIRVTAARIVVANAPAIIIPIVIITVVVLVPTFVPAVVVAIAVVIIVIAVLVPASVPAVVMAIALVIVVIAVLVPAPVSAVVVVLRPQGGRRGGE